MVSDLSNRDRSVIENAEVDGLFPATGNDLLPLTKSVFQIRESIDKLVGQKESAF